MNARNQTGQATVLTLVFLTVLLGMAALVLDVGSWYRADRDTQSTADSAALAGAQALPDSTANASSLASSYASKNGGGLESVNFSSSYGPNDTIKVTIKTAPVTICCSAGFVPAKPKAFCTNASTKRATKTPPKVPAPPKILTPPRTTAVMTGSSSPIAVSERALAR